MRRKLQITPPIWHLGLKTSAWDAGYMFKANANGLLEIIAE